MITYCNTINVEDYNHLRKAVGWNELDNQQATTGLKNTTYLVSAFDGNKSVAMGRLLSDGGYIAFIVDVIVLPDYQHKGIGKTIMDMLLDFIKDNTKDGCVVNVHLMSANGKEEFYKKIGFTQRPEGYMGSGMTLRISK